MTWSTSDYKNTYILNYNEGERKNMTIRDKVYLQAKDFALALHVFEYVKDYREEKVKHSFFLKTKYDWYRFGDGYVAKRDGVIVALTFGWNMQSNLLLTEHLNRSFVEKMNGTNKTILLAIGYTEETRWYTDSIKHFPVALDFIDANSKKNDADMHKAMEVLADLVFDEIKYKVSIDSTYNTKGHYVYRNSWGQLYFLPEKYKSEIFEPSEYTIFKKNTNTETSEEATGVKS